MKSEVEPLFIDGMAEPFWLVRDEDISGVSGTGVVADGVRFPDGVCVLHWRGDVPSTGVYVDLAAVEAVHGHNGATRVVFYDEREETVA